MRTPIAAAALAASLTLAVPARAALLYQNNFDGNLATGEGVTASAFDPGSLEAASAGPWNANGWDGNTYANRTTGNPATATELTLTGLAPHSNVTLQFLLGFLETWDSNVGDFPQGDFLDVIVDGVVVATLTSNNRSGPVRDYAGGTELCTGPDCQLNANLFGDDSLVDMSTATFATFAHSAASLTIALQARGQGWQGGTDEAWGVDNILVTYDAAAAVPEPATGLTVMAGFALMGAALRRRGRGIRSTSNG